MHIIDILIFIVYMLFVLGIGIYFLRKNKNADDYYVGGRSMGSSVIGLSVVATDVGGGFSIGLGGLGFLMGLSGSWMLFTGLLGAWLSAVFLIPKAGKLSKRLKLYTFPQLFEFFYSPRVALLAGIISAVGYIGFTSSQLLAGAKLASATFEGLDMTTALIFMGVIAVAYTAMGGLKAVIYTDVVQWIILLAGLILIGIPLGYHAIGGMEAIRATLPEEFLKLNNIGWPTILNWAVTIIPIWFVGMTLYQRIYATRTPKEAQKAWYIAGAFEWPIMAFMGVILGLFARVAFENGMFAYMGFAPGEMMDAEMGLPLLLRTILPVGLMGLMMAAYFSAVMSTADSCIMAASGNIESDILKKIIPLPKSKRTRLIQSQLITLGIGLLGLLIALRMENVLELMLHSYAFMVSGLFVPVLGAFFTKRGSATGAFWSMITGGATTLTLTLLSVKLPYGLDPNIFGITAAAICFLLLSKLFPGRRNVID
ncbi:MAG TPA: sodium:solute symporter family protein [Proteiniphilum sp.]|nr:sodium:solute symporter family protein [Proteiniphilum sp.]HPJ50123.1 sodium:solute symporter family protein [Proteiniphilum sp.]HPR19033.1 sodium:solute symporter family protein [Proteiniphilum sp.]